MKVLIWEDIEGISGIDNPDSGFNDDIYKQLATKEINAVIKGLKKAGAIEIDIFDGHGMGDNLFVKDLDPIANYLGGGWMVTLADLIKREKIPQYDALVLVGFHAQTGTKDGFIAHTNSAFTALRMNGQPIGEIEQAAWLAGHFEVPLIFVSGDDEAVKEARHYFPEVETVSTKWKKCDSFVCKPIERAYEEIIETAFKALRKLNEIEPYTCEEPIVVEIIFGLEKLAKNMALLPGYELKDNRTVVYHAGNYLEAFWAYHGFRPVLSSVMSEYYQKIVHRVKEEFKLDDQNDLKPIVKEVKEEFLRERLPFPEIKL